MFHPTTYHYPKIIFQRITTTTSQWHYGTSNNKTRLLCRLNSTNRTITLNTTTNATTTTTTRWKEDHEMRITRNSLPPTHYYYDNFDPQQYRHVWHSGYMDAKAVEDIQEEIEIKRQWLQYHATQVPKRPPPPAAAATMASSSSSPKDSLEKIFNLEQELQKLYKKYYDLTGEVYEEDVDDCQSVLHNMKNAPHVHHDPPHS